MVGSAGWRGNSSVVTWVSDVLKPEINEEVPATLTELWVSLGSV